IYVAPDRPRKRSSPGFLRLRGEILELRHFAGNATRDRSPGVGDSSSGQNQKPPEDAKPEEADLAPRYTESRAVRSPAPPSEPLDAQVIIIGGGPAGSSLGA